MNAFRHIAGLSSADFDDRKVSLAIGMFDGVHVGHRKVFDSAVQTAAVIGSHSGALVFWPHPSRIFRPEAPTLMISTPEMKRDAMNACGLSFVIEEPFTRELASIQAEQFVEFLKSRLPSLVSVHVGENWKFGKGRSGDAELLVRIAEKAGVEAHIVNSVEMGADRVSSTRIREALKDGRINDANEMLGRPYELSGIVQAGRRLGRTIGIPTLNIPFTPELAPKFGVYLGEVGRRNCGDDTMPAVFNVGVRPTVDSDLEPLVEAHALVDECPLTYGDEIKAVFNSFIRPELKFDGIESLRNQIELDVREARSLLNIKRNG